MYSVVITAAGSGTRAKLGYNKMLFEISGITILERVVRIFTNNQVFNEVIVTASENDFAQYQDILKDYPITLTIGGSERMDSVACGVSKCTNDFVFVHDGARIYLDDELISRLVDYQDSYDGLALALNATDTTLLASGNRIEKVLDRNLVYNMQTPQVVNRQKYLKCYKQAKASDLIFTDEVSMLSYYNLDCHIVLSESYNKKLTRPEDFEV